jgi:cell division septal protein FtsQ
MGANKRKQSGQRRHAWGGALKKAATKGASISTAAIIAVCVCGAAVFAAVKASAWINRSPMFTVATIRVEGAVRVDQGEAVRLSGIKQGMPMLSLHPATSERMLCTSAWVKTAHVARRFPNTIVIKLTERTPIALVNIGYVRYMDESGVLLPLFAGTYSNLPVISGLGRDSAGCMPGAAVARVRGFLDGCTDGDAVMAHRISQIDFTSAATALLTMEDFATTVEMTDADAGIQMRRLARLAQYGMAEPASQPARIDLRFENLAYVQR